MHGIIDLADLVSQKSNISKVAAREVIENTLAAISELTQGKDVLVLRGFGTFKRKTRVARNGTNPYTKKPIKIPEKTSLGFKER